METLKQKKERRRKRKIVILNALSAMVVLAAVAWGISVFFHLDKLVYTEDAQVEADINPINTRIPGYIREIRFSEHQPVKKGDTLVILDAREYAIQEQQAASLLADAQATKAVASSGSAIASNGIHIADANLEELKARLENMETNYRRYENLLKDEAITRYQFDQVKTELDAMRARYHALEAQHEGTELTTSESTQRIRVADANIQKATAALNMARLNLSYTVITAPYDGVVGRKMIEEGQLLQAGQPVVVIVRGNDKWVTANYTEAQIEKLHIGQAVDIKIDALSKAVFSGKIAAISEATGSRYSAVPVDNSTGNFVKVQQRIPVKIAFTEKNSPSDIALLRVGMNAEVKVSH
ncbi:MAG: HlyD family secretion protein [Puia sp.]|nr:HlyD family secretion protein [Puia sp.]